MVLGVRKRLMPKAARRQGRHRNASRAAGHQLGSVRNADPDHYERGGWIAKNGFWKRLFTGQTYSIEYATPSSEFGIHVGDAPSNAVASYTHTIPELDSDLAGRFAATPPGTPASTPGPSCCDAHSDMGVPRTHPDYVITNVQVYRLDPNNDVYMLGRHWLIQGL